MTGPERSAHEQAAHEQAAHGHALAGGDEPRGLRRNATAIVAGLLILGGLWLLPDLAPQPTQASPVELVRGVVVEELGPGEFGSEPRVRVEIVDGARAGESYEAYQQGPSGQLDAPPYRVGDEVVVSISDDGVTEVFVAVADRWRIPALGLLLGLFAVAVTLVGGWRGIRSLIALALTLGVVVRIVVPLLLAGWDPVPLAIVAATGVTIVTLLLTEGVRAGTFAAVAGTFGALALTGILAATFNVLAGFTELQGQADLAFLQSIGLGELDLGGLLLAAVMLGALGVLDDVTVTQAAAVRELHEADRRAPRGRLFARAMEVGRSHIAATVNTLVLAYVGASLPLIVLFAAGRQDPLLVASGETVAVEVVRAIVGSIGIVAAVPLTTGIAVLLLETSPSESAAFSID